MHAGQYTIERSGSCDKELSTQNKAHIDTLVFKTKSNETMEQSPELRKPLCNVESFFAQQWPDIKYDTGKTQWCGESMDYSMAIDGLFRRDKWH